jgi:hypothetical protein
MSSLALIGEGDLIAARVVASGTNEHSLEGESGTNRRSFSAAQKPWFRVQDGRLAEHWATRDDLTAMLQLGIVPPPEAIAKPSPETETRTAHLPGKHSE